MVLKGTITNPDSIIASGGNSNLLVNLTYLNNIKIVDLSGYNNPSGINEFRTSTNNIKLTTIKGSTTKDAITINSTNLKLIDAGAGDDTVTFNVTQTNDVTVNLGAGNDTITTAALTANKKFEISGGAGNDKFKLAASTTTDNTASKYVTITDASRGDKIGLSDSVTGFVKTNANATSGQTDLKDAINAALASQGTTTANNIYAVYYGNETYLVRDADASKTLSAGDNLVKLAGLSNYDVLNGNVITDTDGATKLLEITNA
jgi:putative surface layer protein sapA8 (fragment)